MASNTIKEISLMYDSLTCKFIMMQTNMVAVLILEYRRDDAAAAVGAGYVDDGYGDVYGDDGDHGCQIIL